MSATDLHVKLREGISRLNELFQKDLITRSDWGAISFIDAKPHIDKVKQIVNYLLTLPTENLPDQVCSSIVAAINPLESVLKQIDAFSISVGTPADASKAIMNSIKNQADTFYSTTSQWIPYLAYLKGDISTNIENLLSSVEKGRSIALSAEAEAKLKQDELNKIISAAREASASAGAAVFTKEFEDEHLKYSNESEKWLKAGIICLMVTIFVAIIFWYVASKNVPENNFQMLQILVSKLIILSMLIYGSTWCGKNYRIFQHLSTLNKHRSLSIRTLQAFIAAATDEQTKNSVLIEANRAVFSSGGTGFLEANSEKESPLTIVEMVKTLAKSK